MDFYTKKYSGRRLQWYNSLGSCVLRAYFPKGTKELSVSLFQAVVLCLFNDAPSLSFQVCCCVLLWALHHSSKPYSSCAGGSVLHPKAQQPVPGPALLVAELSSQQAYT